MLGHSRYCHCFTWLWRAKKKIASVCREETQVGLMQRMIPHKACGGTKVFMLELI